MKYIRLLQRCEIFQKLIQWLFYRVISQQAETKANGEGGRRKSFEWVIKYADQTGCGVTREQTATLDLHS